MQVERSASNDLTANQLPDGSRLLFDAQNEKVFALNATAGAAWDACTHPTTLTKVTEEMQRSLGTEIGEDVAENAILQLQEQNLVKTSGSAAQTSRRQFLTRVGMVAVPMVVSLTVADQKAYAFNSNSAGNNSSWQYHPEPPSEPIFPFPGKDPWHSGGSDPFQHGVFPKRPY